RAARRLNLQLLRAGDELAGLTKAVHFIRSEQLGQRVLVLLEQALDLGSRQTRRVVVASERALQTSLLLHPFDRGVLQALQRLVVAFEAVNEFGHVPARVLATDDGPDSDHGLRADRVMQRRQAKVALRHAKVL